MVNSQLFDWILKGPLKTLNFQNEAKVEEITAIITTHSISYFKLYNKFLKQGSRDEAVTYLFP